MLFSRFIDCIFSCPYSVDGGWYRPPWHRQRPKRVQNGKYYLAPLWKTADLEAEAHQTVLTDYDDEKLLSYIRRNLKTCLSPDQRHRAHVVGHIWGRGTEDLLEYVFWIIFHCLDVFTRPVQLRPN